MSSDSESFYKLVDEYVVDFLRSTMGGQSCTAQFICDCLINSVDDIKWRSLPDGQHIFYIKESLIRLLRTGHIKEFNQMTKGAYLDDIISVKRKRETAYKINYAKIIEQYSQT